MFINGMHHCKEGETDIRRSWGACSSMGRNLLVFFKSFTAKKIPFLRQVAPMGLVPKDRNPFGNEDVLKCRADDRDSVIC